MKKLTAVEWLVEQIFENHTIEWQKQIEQAKEMEKEQTIDFANDWKDDCVTGRYDGEVIELKSAEQYYNETYKSE